ncbi:MAG: barstar family protein [Blastocatellia bacterium]
MSVFSYEQMNTGRKDLELLLYGTIILYHNVLIMGQDVADLKDLNYKIVEFDCRNWTTKNKMHKQVKELLEFPDYYGKNLDALVDCLRHDVIINEKGGLCILLKNFEIFKDKFSEYSQSFLNVLAYISHYHQLFGKILLTLVHSNNPKIDSTLAPVGAFTIYWNPKEFLDSTRGLSDK